MFFSITELRKTLFEGLFRDLFLRLIAETDEIFDDECCICMEQQHDVVLACSHAFCKFPPPPHFLKKEKIILP